MRNGNTLRSAMACLMLAAAAPALLCGQGSGEVYLGQSLDDGRAHENERHRERMVQLSNQEMDTSVEYRQELQSCPPSGPARETCRSAAAERMRQRMAAINQQRVAEKGTHQHNKARLFRYWSTHQGRYAGPNGRAN